MSSFVRALLLPPLERPVRGDLLAVWVFSRLSLLFGFAWSLSATDRIDLDACLASGRAALAGANAYAPQHPLIGADQAAWALPNLNPPISLLLFAPLSALPPTMVAWMWYGLSLLVAMVCFAWLWRAYPGLPARHAACLLGLAGLWHTLVLGQVYALLLPVVVGAWLSLEARRPYLSGLLLAVLVAWKPQFGLWPALLLVRGEWRVALSSAAGFAIACLLPLPVFGVSSYADWLVAARQPGAWENNGSSLLALAARIGVFPLGLGVVVAGVIALGWWVLRTRPPRMQVGALALVATLLCSPISWIGYTLFLLPVWFAWSRWSAATHGLVALFSAGTILLLAVPAILVGAPGLGAQILGSLYTVGLVALGAALIATDPLAEPGGRNGGPHPAVGTSELRVGPRPSPV